MLLMQKKSTSGLYKRLSTKRSLALKGIPITDSHKLRPHKLRLCKLRPHKLRPRKLRLASKLDKNLRKNLCSNLRSSLRSILHRQPQAIKRLKFLKLPYLKLRPTNNVRSNIRSNVRKNLRQFHQLFQLLYHKLS